MVELYSRSNDADEINRWAPTRGIVDLKIQSGAMNLFDVDVVGVWNWGSELISFPTGGCRCNIPHSTNN